MNPTDITLLLLCLAIICAGAGFFVGILTERRARRASACPGCGSVPNALNGNLYHLSGCVLGWPDFPETKASAAPSHE